MSSFPSAYMFFFFENVGNEKNKEEVKQFKENHSTRGNVPYVIIEAFFFLRRNLVNKYYSNKIIPNEMTFS